MNNNANINQNMINQNMNKVKKDACYINQQFNQNKSIFNYMTDQIKFVNKNECFDITPPFLSYIPVGIPGQNVDIENELRGSGRNNSKCSCCKFNTQHPELASNGVSSNNNPNNNSVCQQENMILPNGYLIRK
jgi:hypothetical protein